jgi:NDP-sugar pyrophosphorylase family protein
MKIVLPMAGVGARFLRAGYPDIKPLIPVDGVPMIQRAVGLFPRDADFVFVCNEEHLERTPLRTVLAAAAPAGEIRGIAPHKEGPVRSCFAAFDAVDDGEEVFVNYCDLLNRWDWRGFLDRVRAGSYDGALPAFRGFHPASLGDTYYAYMRTDERDELIEIREKASFTANRMDEFASAGGYYFRTGAVWKSCCREAVQLGLHNGGEFYLSLPMNLLVRDGRRVLVTEVPQHIVLGTPQDHEVYDFWSRLLAAQGGTRGTDPPELRGLVVPGGRPATAREASYWASYFAWREDHPFGKAQRTTTE